MQNTKKVVSESLILKLKGASNSVLSQQTTGEHVNCEHVWKTQPVPFLPVGPWGES